MPDGGVLYFFFRSLGGGEFDLPKSFVTKPLLFCFVYSLDYELHIFFSYFEYSFHF